MLSFITGVAVTAQQYNFRNWTLADGLPQSKVNDIIQDHRMQIWVATRGGISRFDGNTFYTYTRQQGLASNNASCLFQDSRNNIWIGSTDNGITRYNGKKFNKYGIKAGLPPGGVNSIIEDNIGKLWVATGSGVYTLNGTRFTLAPEFPKQTYTKLLYESSGKIWAGSVNNGLYRLQKGKTDHFKAPQHKLPSNTITAIYSEADAGKVWIGTTNGPAYFTGNKITILPLPASVVHSSVADFTRNAYGNILIGLQNDGLITINEKEINHTTRVNGLSSNQTTSLLFDKEGIIWVGTNGQGLQQLKDQWFMHYFDLGTIKDPSITALAKDTKGRVWFGTTKGDAAYMQNGKLTTLETKVWPAGTVLHNMLVRSETDVWVSTNQGVWNLQPGSVRHYTTTQGLPSNEVYYIAADKQGKLWFATANGVAYLDNNKFIPVHPTAKEATGKVYYIFLDRRQKLWIGTDKGIYYVNNDQLHNIKPVTKHTFGEVTSISEDDEGWLYFGGFNYGLLAFHEKNKEVRLFNSTNGLPNDGIKSIYTDRNNNLWVGTSNNVLKIDLSYFHQTKKLNFRTYSGHNGFTGLEVSTNGITETPDGAIWFGTAKGLTKYIPELDRINKATPELLLTDIKLFMRPTNWKQFGFTIDSSSGLPVNLKLPHNKNHITFDFQGICLSAPSEVKYKYMLTGHDQQWSEATNQSFASYANLAPGTYTFKLKAQNNDGYWTSKPLTYSFMVAPPVWRREWFIGLLLLLATGVVISVVRFREQSLVKMNSLLDMRVKHRTRMLERKHREKELLLQEVHHRVKNNLQIVISLLNLQARHVKDPEAKEVMQAIKSRVRSMALLHERLYRHDNLEHIDLASYFREIFNSLYAAYGVSEEKVLLQIQIPPVNVDIDTAITLGLIVNELVSNTLKYAFPGTNTGILGIDLLQQDKTHYQLTVWDNGIGSSQEHDQQQSFGLQLVNSLSKKLNGYIKFEQNNGTKSILFFVLPS
ncbi:hypothetical protein H8S95_08605 [Pontibacter sp. KCTC 32443]|uniref:two-component regulator propeller domain-containing protein n=1 Tax=Pontibacter TaxID=323449 RepID=UPI00164D564B|nr:MULTISPECIES: two-component regulator propeller domain-containing protein [Pontibacter]MBC5774120.1 hypothetical protein [Pontibacter sp. KCTC 32443]